MYTIKSFTDKYVPDAVLMIDDYNATLMYNFITGNRFRVQLFGSSNGLAVTIKDLQQHVTTTIFATTFPISLGHEPTSTVGRFVSEYDNHQKRKKGAKAIEKLKELKELHQDLLSHLPLALQCYDLADQLKLLITHFRYIPGSSEYEKAKSEFDIRKCT
nr:hypothetical protein K-LCC10_0360 [Kaumoebavirus]